MNRLFMLALLATLLSGCASLSASSAWKDRPVGELIDFFGVPRQIMVVPEEDMVVLRYVRDSSYVSREAAGTYTGPQNGQLVHAEYWEDVQHSGSCEINVFVNRARLVQKVRTKGRCVAVEMAPAGQRMGHWREEWRIFILTTEDEFPSRNIDLKQWPPLRVNRWRPYVHPQDDLLNKRLTDDCCVEHNLIVLDNKHQNDCSVDLVHDCKSRREDQKLRLLTSLQNEIVSELQHFPTGNKKPRRR